MTARSDEEFDPRFDPAFQRGFEGVARATPRPAESRAISYAPPPATAVPPLVGAPPLVASPPAVEGAAPAHADSERSDVAAPDEPSRPNPFLIALGAVAVVLVAAGLWGIQAARAPFIATDVASNIDYVGLQILQLIAPVSVALGAATGIGILFVFAVGWQKRR